MTAFSRYARIAALIVLCAAPVAAQDQTPAPAPAQAQTFRSAVDLVPVDVNIVDRTGRPVTGLESDDFLLTVDGKPRRIATAQYIPAGEPPAGPPPPTYYSSNVAAAGGRLIMLVVDQGNIGAGRGKLALDAASRFISKLGPADRVALVAIPGSGPQVDFTSNHAVVQAMLPRLIGQAPSSQGPLRVGLAESVEIQRGDQIAMQEVLDRECAGIREPNEVQDCTQRLTIEANAVYQAARDRTRNSLASLRYLVERLASTPSPKTLVLLSEGIVLERDLAEVSWLGPAAAKGQVVVYVLHLDTPASDAAAARTSPSRNDDLNLGEEGLSLIAGLARGSVMRVVSTADNAFSRLALELSGYYLLSFEPEAGDRDGKTHKIKIEVPDRKGVEIRSRSQFTVEPTRSGSAESLLAAAIRAPLLTTDIGLKVTAFTLRDAASPKLRVVFAAEIDRSVTSSGPLALAYTVMDSRGRLVTSQFEPDVRAPVREPSKLQTYVGSVLTDSPGALTVKLAVVDDAGKRGTVEHTFRAQMTSAGQLHVTDLLIAENTGSIGAGGLVPAVTADFTTDTLHGYVELYSEVEDQLTNASVAFEVSDSENGRPIDSAPGRIQPASPEAPGRRTAEGAITLALLPPGEYVARAVVSVHGTKTVTVSRPFKISRTISSSSSSPGDRALSARAPIPFTSRIDAFERSAVLTPQVVGFFLDRMNVGLGGQTVAPAIAQAKAGKFEDAVAAASKAGNDKLAAVFLQGLALYSKNDITGAREKFRETLRIDSEFFPAAFYLGSCYAAIGNDREAVGAWQTSLVTESDAPFIYTLLGDALLRLRDADQAVDILKEASTLWPDSEQVQLRLGTALAMAGKSAEALKVLQPYLDKHLDDHERLFVALRLLYEGKSAGHPIVSAQEDKALFERYATAYAAAQGPQRAVVDQWKRFMAR